MSAVLDPAATGAGRLLVVVVVMVVTATVVWPVPRARLPVLPRPAGCGGAGAPAPSGGGDEPADGGRGADDAARSGAGPPWAVRWRPPARRAARERALAGLVAALAAPLRAGVPPTVAVAAAQSMFDDDATLGPLLRDLRRESARGGSLAGIWLSHARAHQSADLSFIGRAWALSELTGAPLADALSCGEQVLRARARARDRLASATAGPRASMAVLCLLPASGPVVGAALGVDPLTLYFSSPVGTFSLVLGLGLTLASWWWSHRILRRAA